jgi:site-specific DNA recombinase
VTVNGAIYARVSSDRQAEAGTVESQVADLRARVAADGLDLPAERQFIDDGVSGTTLVRPALERLRDLAAVGGLDRLYVHAPDRLARRYAYQVLLVEELTGAGVEVVFLNRPLGTSPEEALLLQVQGIMAEYERATFLERSRRGKRHAARAGSVSARPKAPYGYRYVGRRDGAEPRYEPLPEQAQVVRQIFAWVGRERLTLGRVVRRLEAAGVPTATGKPTWGRSAVWTLLRNPTYAGRALYGTRRAGPWRPPLRPPRGRGAVPRHPTTPEPRPPSEWICIPVPALVDEATFAAVQERLEENRQRARQRLDASGTRHVLSGLVVCGRCGYGYYGIRSVETRRRTRREYRYYRCRGSDARGYGPEMCCPNRPVYALELEAAVWRAVRRLLGHPDRLAAEYRRRLAALTGRGPRPAPDGLPAQLDRAKRGLARLIDGYADGLLTKDEFVPRLDRLRHRVAALDAQVAQGRADQVTEAELRLAVGRLEAFAGTVRQRLAGADRATQRELILALVRRVEVDGHRVRVIFKVGPSPPGFDQRRSQHRSGRAGRLAPVARVPSRVGRFSRPRDARGGLNRTSQGRPRSNVSGRFLLSFQTFLAAPP